MGAQRRHHFVPVCLLSCFKTRSDRDQLYVHAIRKSGRRFEINVNKIGLESLYHRSGKVLNPEADIGKLETMMGPKLREWQAGLLNSEESYLASRFVLNLRVRSLGARKLFTVVSNEVVDILCTSLLNQVPPNGINTAMARKLFDEVINRASRLRQQGLGVAEIQTSIQPEINDILHRVYYARVRSNLQSFSKRLDILAAVASMHSDLIVQHLNNAIEHVNQWRIVPIVEGRLVLGDAGALAWSSSRSVFVPMGDIVDDISDVLLPIAPNRLLVGSKTPSMIDNSLPSLSEINNSMARQSADFVVGDISDAEMMQLQALIGVDFQDDRIMRQLYSYQSKAEIIAKATQSLSSTTTTSSGSAHPSSSSKR